MIVNHWTLIDYAYCYSIKGDSNYMKFIQLVNESKSRNLQISELELLGLFYGEASKPPHSVVAQFISGSFKPSGTDFAESFVSKSKATALKRIVGDVFSKLRIAKRINGNVELPLYYFENLIKTYNELVESVILHKRRVGELPDIENRLKSSVEILIKGGFYK
jgi:hypothetical protein